MILDSAETQLDKQGVKYEIFRCDVTPTRQRRGPSCLKALKVRANEKKVTVQVEGKFDMKLTGVQWLVLDSRFGGVYSIENFDIHFCNARARN